MFYPHSQKTSNRVPALRGRYIFFIISLQISNTWPVEDRIESVEMQKTHCKYITWNEEVAIRDLLSALFPFRPFPFAWQTIMSTRQRRRTLTVRSPSQRLHNVVVYTYNTFLPAQYFFRYLINIKKPKLSPYRCGCAVRDDGEESVVHALTQTPARQREWMWNNDLFNWTHLMRSWVVLWNVVARV